MTKLHEVNWRKLNSGWSIDDEFMRKMIEDQILYGTASSRIDIATEPSLIDHLASFSKDARK